MTTVDGHAQPRLARGVRLREDLARGGTVLLAPERVLTPSPTAIAVLERCDGRRSVTAIVGELATAYSADPSVIEADVRRLLGDLAGKGIVQL